MSKRCWRVRGCPEDMKEGCLFFEKNRKCPYSCKFAMCEQKLQIDPLEHFDVLQYTPDPEDESVRSECLSCKRYYQFVKEKYPL